jgi:hypothetical protein
MPAQPFDRHLTDLVRRSNFLTTQIERAAPRVDFAVTSAPTTVDTPTVTVTGTGWINVRQLRLAGSTAPLEVRWTDETQWEALLPLARGENRLALEAIDFQGQLIGSAPLVITSSATNDLAGSLRITELHYNPAEPTPDERAAMPNVDNESFEFLEVTNIGPQPLNLLGAHFTAGLDFVFPATILSPGESAVLVQNLQAFRLRYGDEPRVLGAWGDRRLSNAGEAIELRDSVGTAIASFTFEDGAPWPTAADGEGPSLVLIQPLSTPVNEYGQPSRWTVSTYAGGSPARLPVEGDLNGDRLVTAADLDRFCQSMRAGQSQFDFNADGRQDLQDFNYLIRDVMRTSIGDANLDGLFNSRDLVLISQSGEYEDGLPGNSDWATGDWNCDGEFSTGDLVAAFQFGGYSAGADGPTPRSALRQRDAVFAAWPA